MSHPKNFTLTEMINNYDEARLEVEKYRRLIRTTVELRDKEEFEKGLSHQMIFAYEQTGKKWLRRLKKSEEKFEFFKNLIIEENGGNENILESEDENEDWFEESDNDD